MSAYNVKKGEVIDYEYDCYETFRSPRILNRCVTFSGGVKLSCGVFICLVIKIQ